MRMVMLEKMRMLILERMRTVRLERTFRLKDPCLDLEI